MEYLASSCHVLFHGIFSYSGLSLSRLPSISKKMFGPLKFPPRTLHSLSLFRTSLSRTFPYIEQIFRSLEPFSLSIENLHIRISFSNSRINSNLNQNKNFDRKWKKICFLFSVSSKQKCSSNVSGIRKLWQKENFVTHRERHDK